MPNSLFQSLSEVTTYVNQINTKSSCRLATTAELSNLDQTITSIDRISLNDGDRILVKNQSTLSTNGIYIYSSSSAWSRADDFNEGTAVASSYTFIEEGHDNKDKLFLLKTDNDITIDGDSPSDIVFEEYSSGGNGELISVDKGGTGQTSYTDGQLLIGNTVGNTLSKATLTEGSNISITNGNGSITINTTHSNATTSSDGLMSSNDKTKLDTISSGAEVNVQSNWSETDNSSDTFIQNKPYIATGNQIIDWTSDNAGTIHSTNIPTLNQDTNGSAASLSATLGVSSGGTGQTSYTDGQLLIGNTVGNTLSKATLTGGSNIAITNGNGSITISSTDTNTTYTAGNGLDLSGTEFTLNSDGTTLSNNVGSGQSGVLKVPNALIAGSNISFSSGTTYDGSAEITITSTDTNTTYSNATTSSDGLMSSNDKTKLDTISSGAEVNVQSNWNETDNSSDTFIQNKPYIATGNQIIDWTSTNAGTIHSTNIPTLNQNTTGSAASLSATLGVSSGGTGATNATNARNELGLAIGSDIQSHSVNLDALSGLNSALNKIPIFSGSGTATLIDFKDEDNFDSDSSTAVASQQSIKAYVDSVAQGLHIKGACRVATTANLTSLSGLQTIDGVSLAATNRVLVKNQSNGVQNGIYICSSDNWTRSEDMPAGKNASGDFAFITEGNINGDHGFVCTSDSNSDVVGTNILSFTQFSGAGQITAGDGIVKNGNTLSIDINEYSSIPPTNGDKFLTLDSDTSTEQLTNISDLATLFSGDGLTATNSVLNIIGGNGITSNTNDIEITPEQTTITSVKNSSLEIGRDDDNTIDFGTDNTIIIKTNGSEKIRIDNNGNMGIGINNPGSYDDDGNSLVVGTNGNANNHAGMSIIAGPTSASNLYFGDGTSSSTFSGYLSYWHSSNRFLIGTNGIKNFALQNSIKLRESANADDDETAFGQIWVKNTTPNELYFTTDAGDDIRITNGTSLANASTASALQSSVTINGIPFDGSSNITVPAAGSTLTDTVTVSKGGTGQTSYTDGQLLIGNSTGNTLSKATLTAGSNITISNGNGSITISATDTNTTYTNATSSSDGLMSSTDKIKLNAIETGATADQTASEIRTLVESASDSNVFTDADHSKLNGIASGAEVNVQSNWGETDNSSDAFIQNKPYIATGNQIIDWTIDNAGSIHSTNIPTLNQNTSGSAASLSSTLSVSSGGTGQTSYTDGQLLIGNSTGNTLSKTTLTAGSNIAITNGNGSITIASTDTNTTYSAGNGLDLSGTEFTLNSDGTTLSNNVGSGQSGVLKVPNALTAGSNISFSSGTTYDGSSAITITSTDTNTTYSAGNGLDLSGTEFTLNSDGTTLSNNVGSGQSGVLKVPNALTAGSNISFSSGTTYDGSAAITIASTDTNTTYSAGNGLDLSGTEFSVGASNGLSRNTTGLEVSSSQTVISSILNNDLVVGRDADNQLKFSTDNKMIFRVNGSDNVVIDNAAMNFGGGYISNGVTIYKTVGTISLRNSIRFYETNGSGYDGYVTLKAPDSWTQSSHGIPEYTLTLPLAIDTLVGKATTDTLTNKTLTSPTLTTPVLGTPSSGNLANCTFPTLNQDTTGSAGSVANSLTAGTNISFSSGTTYDGSSAITISASDTTYTAGNGLDLNGTEFSVGASNGILRNSTGVEINPVQTDIYSILNASLAVGSGNDNNIDFSTDNKIVYRVNGVNEYQMVQNSFSPVTNDGAALGTSSLMWSDIYLAAGAKIQYGNSSGEVTITHSSNTIDISSGYSTEVCNLTVDGDITAFSTSDERLKDNIKPIENSLDKLQKLGGYEFEWNKLGEKYTKNKGKDVGIIAQEVEEILPEATTTRKDNYKAVQYDKIIPLLIESIKEQQKIIENLQGQVNELKNMIL